MSTALGQKVRIRSAGGGIPSGVRVAGYQSLYTTGVSAPIFLDTPEWAVTGSVGAITADLSDPAAPIFQVPVNGIYRVSLDVGYAAQDVTDPGTEDEASVNVNEPMEVALYFASGGSGIRLAAKLRCNASDDVADDTHWWVEDGFSGDVPLFDDGSYFPTIEVQYMGAASHIRIANAALSIVYVSPST